MYTSPNKVPPVPSLPDSIPLPPRLRWIESPKIKPGKEFGKPHVYGLPPTPWQLISEDDQNHLLALEDAITKSYFCIGDIANYYIEQAPSLSPKGYIITHDNVYAAVGYFVHRAKRTIRYYAETAAFYPDEIRQQYPNVPFNHFVIARSYGERWREMLDYSQENPGVASDYLLYKFTKEEVKSEENLDEYGIDINAPMPPASVQDVHTNVHPDVYTESSVRQRPDPTDPALAASRRRAMLLASLSGLVDSLGKLQEQAEISESVQIRLQDILQEIRDLIPELKRDLSMV